MVMGPTCGMILADLGAEVIKVEPPGGDKTRKLPGLGIGFFRTFNRNKKSVVLDIDTAAGPRHRARADRPVRRRAGELPPRPDGSARPRLRDAVEDVSRSLIYVSHKGFLPGPYENRLALDEVVQMMGGLSYMTGPVGPAAARRHLGQRHHGRHVRRHRRAGRAARARAHRPRPGSAERAVRELRVPRRAAHAAVLDDRRAAAADALARLGLERLRRVHAGRRRAALHRRGERQAVPDAVPRARAPELRGRSGAGRPTRSASRCGPALLDAARRDPAAPPRSTSSRPSSKPPAFPYAPIMRPDQLLDDPHLKASGGLVPMETRRRRHDRRRAAAAADGRPPAGRAPAAAARRRAHRRSAGALALQRTADLTQRITTTTVQETLTMKRSDPSPRLRRAPRRRTRLARSAALAQAAGKPLRVILPVGAGSGVDTIMRAASAVADQGAGGQPVVIENLPGAGGITGTTAIVKAAPDGQTIGVVSNNHVVNPSVFKKMPFDAHQRHHADLGRRRDAVRAGGQPDKLPAKNAKELQSHCSRPSRAPTTTRRRATAPSSTSPAAMFVDAAGVDVKHMPVQGRGPDGDRHHRRPGRAGRGRAACRDQGHLKSGALRAIGVDGQGTRRVAARHADDRRARLARTSTSPAGSRSSGPPSCRRRGQAHARRLRRGLQLARGQGRDGQARQRRSTRRRPKPRRSSSAANSPVMPRW